MGDDLRQWVTDMLKIGAGGLITWLVTYWRPRQMRADAHDEAQNKTIESQGRTLADAWEKIERQQSRMTELEAEVISLKDDLRKYVNAYARAIRFIHDRMPEVEIPDFLMESKPRVR